MNRAHEDERGAQGLDAPHKSDVNRGQQAGKASPHTEIVQDRQAKQDGDSLCLDRLSRSSCFYARVDFSTRRGVG